MKQIWTLLLVCIAMLAMGQDEHFSQFYAIPTHMNPALTGAYEGTYRMGIIYRDQWNNALESPYNTFAFGGDTRLNINFFNLSKNDHFGVGVLFISDRFREFNTTANQLTASAAYHKKLDDRKSKFLGAGIKLGVIQRNVNYDNLTFEDQFNQTDGYTLPTSELLPPNNVGVFDIAAGINYFSRSASGIRLYIGAAIHHFTNPGLSYYAKLDNPNPTIDLEQPLPTKVVIHTSLDYKINERFELQPRIIYQGQGPSTQVDLGNNLKFKPKASETSFIGGLWVTGIDDLDGFHPETITPLIGLEKGQFIFGFSYDLHLGKTRESGLPFNTLEFSLRFSGEHQNEDAFCPTF